MNVRPRSISSSEDKYVRVSSLRSARDVPVSCTTVHRRLQQAGLHGRISAKKPLLRSNNKKKRLQWAKKHRNWTADDWMKVLWTDKSKF
ncbi:hypothetical protein QQF64_020827 [Cirrhinus molitorella]|uniref:Transposase Tc1-like domain-containing protein n=1 Tax=Cirrhinus molitorella TaxID=172907 RepID=A0ABR3LDS2_9TELE